VKKYFPKRIYFRNLGIFSGKKKLYTHTHTHTHTEPRQNIIFLIFYFSHFGKISQPKDIDGYFPSLGGGGGGFRQNAKILNK
jgi:hypothetical protein